MAVNLKFTVVEELANSADLHQIDDGTIFYVQPTELFVKSKGIEIRAKLPKHEYFYPVMAIGDAVYFKSGGHQSKIYKAYVTASGTIEVSYVRHVLEEEYVGGEGGPSLCTHIREGKEFIYRVGEDPVQDAIHVEHYELNRSYAVAIHRGKAIYEKYKDDNTPPSAMRLSDDVVHIELPYSHVSQYSRDSSKFLYISSKKQLIVFDTDKLEFLPVLNFDELYYHKITGIYKGTITIKAMKNDRDDRFYMMTAQLPEGYFKDDPVYELKAALKKIAKQNANMEVREKQLTVNIAAQTAEIQTIREKHDELDQAIRTLQTKLENVALA